jgi:GH18 family chitinase
MKNRSRLITFIFCSITCLHAWALGQTMHHDRPIVAQYFGVWTDTEQAWENRFRVTTPFTKLNRLYIADARVVKAGGGHFTITFEDQRHANALLTRMHTENPLAEIIVSVSGDGNASSYGGASHDEKFAENVVAFLHQYNLHGINIDWRFGGSKEDLTALLKSMHDVLHPAGYLVTLDAWQFVSPRYDVPVIKNYLDQINIMSYGTGISLDVCTSDYLKSGFSAKQLIGSIESETGYKKYGGVTDTLGDNGTIQKKATYAKSAGLAGMANWRMDNDYVAKNVSYPEYKAATELWNAMSTD